MLQSFFTFLLISFVGKKIFILLICSSLHEVLKRTSVFARLGAESKADTTTGGSKVRPVDVH